MRETRAMEVMFFEGEADENVTAQGSTDTCKEFSDVRSAFRTEN